jgi:amino acid adenylation domain-containing protein
MITLVQEYFSQSAHRFPHKVAISCEQQELTFTEAENISNALAHALKEAGVQRSSFVPFFLKKSPNSILSILGILKADCAYVPLDINSPAQRLKSILQATQASLVVVDNYSQPILQGLLGDQHEMKLLNIDAIEHSRNASLNYQNLSIDIAYVLFTSGSTGIPKGVMIPHKAIIDYIDWCVETYELTDQDVISNHAPLYFDNSTFDLYTAFKTGATLHLVHDELNAVIPALVKWIQQREITTFFCVPSVMTLLAKSRRIKPDSFPKLRHVIFAGEVLPPDVLKTWMDLYPHIQFTNMYGPTEITVDCSFYTVRQKPDESTKAIPIGKARKNMELFVRTESGELSQQPGARGELLVRGTSVAYGYLGDREKTERAFIQNPNHSIFHDPLYCTGDLVEIDENGDYIFIGRADNQVKFLGYRIELGEIEASLTNIEGVVEGVVVFGRNPVHGNDEIGALVQLETGLELADLVKELQQRLPPYMVPTLIRMTQDDFPRTANGKYDRKAIAALVYRADA